MIEYLQISGLGVIGAATVDLDPGFTVVTGETGAGKTMVVTALGLLLGRRTTPASDCLPGTGPWPWPRRPAPSSTRRTATAHATCC